LKFPGDVFYDPTAESFKALNLPRLSVWQALKRFLSNKARVVYGKLAQEYDSDLEGEGLQTGGVFVVGPGIGKKLSFYYKEADEDMDVFAEARDVLAACGWTPAMEAEWQKEHKEKKEEETPGDFASSLVPSSDASSPLLIDGFSPSAPASSSSGSDSSSSSSSVSTSSSSSSASSSSSETPTSAATSSSSASEAVASSSSASEAVASSSSASEAAASSSSSPEAVASSSSSPSS